MLYKLIRNTGYAFDRNLYSLNEFLPKKGGYLGMFLWTLKCLGKERKSKSVTKPMLYQLHSLQKKVGEGEAIGGLPSCWIDNFAPTQSVELRWMGQLRDSNPRRKKKNYAGETTFSLVCIGCVKRGQRETQWCEDESRTSGYCFAKTLWPKAETESNGHWSG